MGATVFCTGGLAYYMYSEYKPAIHRYMPWLDHLPFSGNSKTKTDQAKIDVIEKQARAQRRKRVDMVPKSSLEPTQQVNWAWSNPGLYLTGSNEYGLIDPLHPDSGVGYKAAVPGLQGKLLRSAAFAKTHAAAVDADGNLYQWGTGFVGGNLPHKPVCTLHDSSVREVATSKAFVAVLDSKSRVRILRGDNSQVDNMASVAKDPCGFVEFKPRLGWREHVVSISAGEDHLAARTSSGNVYTCALGASGNDRHQLGHSAASVPSDTNNIEPFVLMRIQSKHLFSSVVCGGRHTLLQTTDGEVYGCGANDFGQLAMGPYAKENATVRQLTPLRRIWTNSLFDKEGSRAESISAGSATSYVHIREGASRKLVSFGRGIDGQLGNGSMSHIQGTPVVVRELSDKQEYDLASKQQQPLGIRSMSAAGDHIVVVCDNQTNVTLDGSGNSFNKHPLYGYDVLVWGNNESGQCIPDRKHRISAPAHPPLLYKHISQKSDPGNRFSTSSKDDVTGAFRLQAAPKQWVLGASFNGSESHSGSSKKYLVEQVFVAGPDVTAAFLKQC
ncbi:hypothetical protein H4S06_004505 [Coemansia sp. BCRC 34490]|nr:hypothetical protein H4S06_004505 [Coemansia sp. BCRC 34490]